MPSTTTMLPHQGIPPPGRRRPGSRRWPEAPAERHRPVRRETEPLPIERAAHATDSNERCRDANDRRRLGCRARRNISKVRPNLHVSAHRQIWASAGCWAMRMADTHPPARHGVMRPSAQGQRLVMMVVTGSPNRRSARCGRSARSQRDRCRGSVATMISSNS